MSQENVDGARDSIPPENHRRHAHPTQHSPPSEFGLQGLYAVAAVITTLGWLLFSGGVFVYYNGSLVTIQFLVSLPGMAALWWAYFEAERGSKQRALAALASAAGIFIVWLPLFLTSI